MDLHATPQLSKAFRDGLLSTGVFSDIELHLPASRIIKAHSVILSSQSTWFAEDLPGKKSVNPTALKDATLQHFGFEGYGVETHAHNLTAMITFCYTGSYGLPDLLEHDNASEEIQQACFLLQLYVHLLAWQYGIPSLVKHSFENMETMADTLREMYSRVCLAVIQRLMNFSGFNKGDPMIPFALEQIQLVIRDGAAERTISEWICERCDTSFQVPYLQREGAGTDFSLEECPNCGVTDDASDQSMESETRVKIEKMN